MNKHYDKINFNFDIPKLKENLSILLNRVPLRTNQVCLMHQDNCNNPYYAGCGSLLLKGDYSTGWQIKKTVIYQEKEFVIFNKELKNTYFYTIYKEISNHLKITRMRIMALNQKCCLTWHRDPGKRIHIPIITDEKCKFVLEDTAFHLPADGSAYIIDTTKYHTVFNGSTIIRIHLVCSILDEKI